MAKDPYQYFRLEARELLEAMSQGILELERNADPKPQITRVLRPAHTLKGAARVVKCVKIAGLCHEIEELLAPHREATTPVPRDCIDTILNHLDQIQREILAIDAPQLPPPALPPPPTSSTLPPPPPPLPASDLVPIVRLEVKSLETLQENAQSVMVQLSALRQSTDSMMDLQHLLRKSHGVSRSPLHPGTGLPAPTAHRGNGDSTPEIVEVVSKWTRNFRRGLDRICRDLGQLQDEINHLRLFEANQMFSVLERSARDAARSRGVEIEFVAVGGTTRLDAHVLSTLQGALIHVVRNAVAHGIEPPSERLRKGKPPAGKITVAFHGEGHRARISCQDDGRGVDLAAVRQAAVTRGLISPERAATMTPDQVGELVFQSGLTTSTTVTELSGRGVGLDVVRDVLHQLQGEVSLTTEPDRSTTVVMRVPVSLFSFPALTLSLGSYRVFVPLDAVSRVIQVSRSDVGTIPDGQTIIFENQVIPFLPLATPLSWPVTPWRERTLATAVVIRSGSRRAAFQVDRVLELVDVVMQSLPAPIAPHPLVSGAMFDAEGNPQLVIDPAGLVEAAFGQRSVMAQTPRPRRRPVLVVDDSLTTRMLEQSILETAGYEVELATSAEEAMDKARVGSYGLFIVDVEMPGMNGYEFVARTRADPGLGLIPAILVTSLSSDADRERGIQAGACAYITKGEFEQNSFLKTIEELMG